MDIERSVTIAEKYNKEFDYSSLEQRAYRIFFIIMTRVNNSLDVTDARFRNLADVMVEFREAVREMRVDIETLVNDNLNQVYLTEELSLVSIFREFNDINVDDGDMCLTYLEGVISACTIALSSVEEEPYSEHEEQLLTAILFIVLATVRDYANVFGKVDLAEQLKGVEICLDKKRRRA